VFVRKREFIEFLLEPPELVQALVRRKELLNVIETVVVHSEDIHS
jgi:hypothetical protein